MLNYDGITCYTEREKLNKQFKDTNTSMYNIYDKCYKAKNTTGLKYVNTGCEDDAGITNFLNDPSVKEHWNFLANKEWTPCNTTVFEEYRSGQNCFHLLPELIKNKIRIVRILLYSGSFLGILIRIFRLLEQEDGLMSLDILWRCQLGEFGENGGFLEDTQEKIKLEVSSGSSVISPS